MPTVLDTELAQAIAAACERHAREQGWTMTIAVVDTAGNLKHYTRMDGSIQIAIRLSQLKAATSASLPVSTRRFREIAAGPARGLDLTPGTTPVAGGVPILTADGRHLGGLGVSGASEDDDERCALAALETVSHLLAA